MGKKECKGDCVKHSRLVRHKMKKKYECEAQESLENI